ncbi:MAG: PilZ domain [Acidobacteriota bacterium]|jgi:hypothetical protein|nr:PilZ domain [Acidobacteriota bacterium]
MPELIRLIANRLREFVGNRRRAPRYRIRLEAEMTLGASLPGAKTSAERSGQRLKLAGYTRDISETGMAIIVPTIHIGGQYFTDSNRKLQIVLTLPTGLVELHGRPVRYAPLEEGAADAGYLIGVRIESMSDDDRARFKAHIETPT